MIKLQIIIDGEKRDTTLQGNTSTKELTWLLLALELVKSDIIRGINEETQRTKISFKEPEEEGR